MSTTVSKRDDRIDALKGLAIVAVVLYHLGGTILPFGYLGVDIFLVIGGYMMMKSILRRVEKETFSYRAFLADRLVRFWPIILGAGILCFVVGWFLMLPDDYENLCESIVASNFFANNILQCITTGDYWDVVNTFKPLMHLWYIGVLMQAYVLLPLLYRMSETCLPKNRKALFALNAILTVLSLVLYLAPMGTEAAEFYFLPYRLFEICGGAMLAFLDLKADCTGKSKAGIVIGELLCVAVLLLCICYRGVWELPEVKLIATTVATCVLIVLFGISEEKKTGLLRPLAAAGKASFSIYVVHQILIAFMYYNLILALHLPQFLAFAAATGVLSALLYFFAEQPLNRIAKDRRAKKRTLLVCLAVCIVSTVLAYKVYARAGIVRDIPELGVSLTDTHRGQHAEYCDRPYAWKPDFAEESEKVKVYVYGDSFGRDMANILAESSLADSLEIAYADHRDDAQMQLADVVLCTIGPRCAEMYKGIDQNVPAEKLYIVGTKNFGASNGIVYARRNEADYLQTCVPIEEKYWASNRAEQEKFGDHYIDMLAVVRQDDGTVRCFTDDGHYFSQDCRHLTVYGAKYYAAHLDLSFLAELAEAKG